MSSANGFEAAVSPLAAGRVTWLQSLLLIFVWKPPGYIDPVSLV